MREFNKEYQIYKDDFDLELMLYKSGTTYAKAKEKALSEAEWF